MFANFSKMMVEKRKDNEGMTWRIKVASKEMLRAPVTSESGVGSQTGLKLVALGVPWHTPNKLVEFEIFFLRFFF